MNIFVCVKQILDPEIAAKDFSVDRQNLRPAINGSRLVMDSYSEYALETALQVKEKVGGTVTVLSLGDKPADEVLRKALALNVDAAVRLWDPAWSDLDAAATARVLGKAIQKAGGADLVLMGRQAGDVERGLVGPMTAEALGLPCLPGSCRLEVSEGRLRCHREIEGTFVVVQTPLPAVVTITNDESNVLRLPKVKDLMMASRKPIALYGAADLGLEAALLAPGLRVVDLFIPTVSFNCELVAGDDGPAKASALTGKLQQLKLL